MSSMENIQSKKDEILKTAQAYGVTQIRVFGSVAREEENTASDIDFLVKFEPGRTLFDLIGLEEDLEELLGRSVDVITENSLNKYIRDDVLREVVEL